jgi:hypothetical protein
MVDARRRVDKAIAAMSEKQKAELLDRAIGPVLAGSAPDPEADAKYLRGIVEDQLREQDRREANGLAKLERRLDKLEQQLGALPDAVGAAMLDVIDAELERRCLLEYRGVWDEALTYKRGSTVTASNSVWVAVTSVEKGARPGKDPAWRLAAKAPPPPGGAIA